MTLVTNHVVSDTGHTTDHNAIATQVNQNTSDIAANKGLPVAATGATQPTRYVGRWSTVGAPASGTFAVGDFGFDSANTVQICTVAGTPGTFVPSAASATLADKGSWTTGTVYAIGDVVTNSNQRYAAHVAHTASALFATDAAKWTSLDPGPAASLSNATPLADSGAGAPGTGGAVSRDDHSHPAPNLPPTDGFLFQHRSTDTTGNNIACSYDTSTEAFFALGRGNASPCYWTRSVPVKIGLNITTAAALSHVRLIVWDSDGTNGRPGTLIADLGQIDSSTTGRKFSPSSFTPTAYHKYWVAGVQQDATGVQTTSVIKQPWVLPEDASGQFDAQCLIVTGQTAAATSTPTILQPYQGCFWFISQLA